jgi:hypothetical protein
MENNLLQSYRMLFMMVEATLLALAYALFQKGLRMLAPVVIGLLVVIAWVIVCKAKANDVDRWARIIITFKPIINENWFDYLEPKIKLPGGRIARLLFNYFIPILVVLLWIFILCSAPYCTY